MTTTERMTPERRAEIQRIWAAQWQWNRVVHALGEVLSELGEVTRERDEARAEIGWMIRRQGDPS